MTEARRCDCILLAAGLSTRMTGSKMLREFDGVPLVRLAISHALEACARVIVVLGYEAEAVRRAAGEESGRLVFVENPRYRAGMFASIQAGMRAVESEWFFVVPGDMPSLTPAIFATVAAAAPAGEPVPGPGGGSHADSRAGTQAESPHSPLAVVPYYRETRGHPVFVHRDLISRLLDEPPEAGPMRHLLERYPTKRLHLDDPAVTVDLDSDEDVSAHLGGRRSPDA